MRYSRLHLYKSIPPQLKRRLSITHYRLFRRWTEWQTRYDGGIAALAGRRTEKKRIGGVRGRNETITGPAEFWPGLKSFILTNMSLPVSSFCTYGQTTLHENLHLPITATVPQVALFLNYPTVIYPKPLDQRKPLLISSTRSSLTRLWGDRHLRYKPGLEPGTPGLSLQYLG